MWIDMYSLYVLKDCRHARHFLLFIIMIRLGKAMLIGY